MQTFLPYENFRKSAEVLDGRRLGKQRSESIILMKTLLGMYEKGGGWPNHPATKMWKGHERSLLEYSVEICLEWQRRGNKDKCLEWFCSVAERQGWLKNQTHSPPRWLGWEKFHRSHRSNLLRKMPEHYRTYWPDEPDDLPYVWPLPAEKLPLEM